VEAAPSIFWVPDHIARVANLLSEYLSLMELREVIVSSTIRRLYLEYVE